MHTIRTRSWLVAIAALCLWPGEGEAAAQAGRSPARSMRTWTDAGGKYSVRAALDGVEEGSVRLRKGDGTMLTVPLEKLSEADRRWVARQEMPSASAAVPAAAAADEWPTFRGPNHDGKSPDTGLLSQWPPDGPPLLWKATGIGSGFSSVAVSGGVVYVTGEVGGNLIIFGFDSEGKQIRRIDHGPDHVGDRPGARATPTIDGQSLYILGGTGHIACYDIQTGRRKWAHAAQEFGGSPGHWGYAESVLILDSLAIFKPGGKNCIVALDKASGRPVWTSRGFAAGPEYSCCLPFVDQGTPMIATGTSEGLVSVNPRSGALLWGNKFAAGNTANCPTPAYSDGHVFWANGYGKGGICLKLGPGGTASEAWTTGDMECHHGGYIIDDGYIYGNHRNGWVCLELKTGQKKWEERAVGKGSLCWADGMLYLFGEKDGQAALATCSPDGLEIKGRMSVAGSGRSWAHPVVIGGRLYLRYDTNLYCFDVRAH